MPLNALAVTQRARELTPPRISLLTSAEPLSDDDDRWLAGVRYIAEPCGLGGELVRTCVDHTNTPVSGCETIEFKPVTVRFGDKASTFSKDVRDYRARATRQLLACASKLVEAEVWDDPVESDNPFFADAPTLISTDKPDADDVISYLEQGIADCSCGSRMMIHMRPFMLAKILAKDNGNVRLDGDRFVTALGNVIVPGRGYPGTGPGGEAVAATEWVYVTPMVGVYRGPVRVYPDTLAEATERTTNDVTFYAEQDILLEWDTSCCLLSLEVTH